MAATRLAARVALLVLLAVMVGGTSALAHANYVKSVPDSDARLQRAPTEVRVTFSESPEPKLSEIDVLDVGGKRVDNGALTAVDSTTLKVGLTALGDGGYTVAWKAVSAVDGHETRGSFAFVIGSGPLPPPPPDIPVSPPPNPVEIVARILSYAGVALLLGVPFFGRFIARRDEDRRGAEVLTRIAAVAVVAGCAILLQQTGGLGLVASRLGVVITSRGVVAAVAAFAPWPNALLALGALAAATLTLQSHAAGLDDPVGIALDYVHVLAVGAWVGGLVMLSFVALPRRGTARPVETRDLGALVSRFSKLGIAAVVVIVATGTLQSLRRLLDVRDLIETPYGLALLAKIALLACAVGLASLNLLRYGPRLRANVDGMRMKRLLSRGVRGEVAIVAAILVAASILTALSPPNYATGAAFVGVQHVNGLRVELLMQSPNPGLNKYDVRLQDGLQPPANVERVTIRFTLQEHDMGEQELTAAAKGAGDFVATGSPSSMYGHWNALVIVRRTGLEDARALFTVPVLGGAGGLQTKVVPAGQLNLIVYTDPPLPVAGQPLTIFAIVTDQTGNPLQGAQLRGEVEGKSYDAVAEQGLRYRIDLPALSAGDKKIDLVVKSGQVESRGTYDVTIAP